MDVLFVCTSNTCRSPVAELFAVEWLKRRLDMDRAQQEEKGIRIHSAAITDVFDKQGSCASAHAISVMKEYQIDLSQHRTRLLTAKMCEEADYIVCVSMGHRDKVRELFPRIKEMKGTLCKLSRDVPDPWHMDYDTYMQNVALMEELVSEFMEKTFTW
ncbi:hypothetical protein Poli38472_011605 [Pythium oligandrum]|uniref:Phosphotyrosine protein phosphatase I domain-containing protein n=1 Tax=Pythium oligandrum TaxID=41045 RepID=A0A8K1FI87_PYTOL|nr:hypothetical protein Poli38472_011605 [Pythium oligandrum]|eukprot:TMW64725.1 hypothetical protein Poli38472_011605 [Pythium oligandrum]